MSAVNFVYGVHKLGVKPLRLAHWYCEFCVLVMLTIRHPVPCVIAAGVVPLTVRVAQAPLHVPWPSSVSAPLSRSGQPGMVYISAFGDTIWSDVRGPVSVPVIVTVRLTTPSSTPVSVQVSENPAPAASEAG